MTQALLARPADPPQLRSRRRDNSPLVRVVYMFAVLGPIVATIVAIAQSWQHAVRWIDVGLLVTMYGLTAIGITVGFHRYQTHRGFIAPGIIKFVLLALGSMAIEGPVITWVSTHLEHHARSDRDGDPHSPVDGFLHAHVGWIVDGFSPNPKKYGAWLLRDPLVVFFDRTFWGWVILSFAIPLAVDGWRGLLWGGLVRVFLVHHVTWSVNSVCHVFGKRPFRTGDQSTNHWLVGLLAGGEGWHNNHHAFQRNAFHGLFWWQFDMAGLLIRTMERLHLINDVQRVPIELIRKRLREARGLEPIPEPVHESAEPAFAATI